MNNVANDCICDFSRYMILYSRTLYLYVLHDISSFKTYLKKGAHVSVRMNYCFEFDIRTWEGREM